MKKIIAISLLVFTNQFIFSQEEKSSKFDFGFFIEGNKSFLNTKDEVANDVKLKTGFGFGLGISSDYKMSFKQRLSAKAGLSFNKAELEYEGASVVQSNYQIYPQNLDFGLYYQYLMLRGINHYIAIGPSVQVPLTPKEFETITFSNRTGVSLDFAFAFEQALSSFRFAPELRFSLGLTDVNSSSWTGPTKFHRLTLTLHFKD